MSPYITWVRILDKTIQHWLLWEKYKWNDALGEEGWHESVSISVIARVCNNRSLSHFFMCFARGQGCLLSADLAVLLSTAPLIIQKMVIHLRIFSYYQQLSTYLLNYDKVWYLNGWAWNGNNTCCLKNQFIKLLK